MSTSEVIVEILKYAVPAIIVLVGMILVMRESQKKMETEQRYGLYQKTLAEIIPLRLQAHERVILLLERISPENLLIRVDARGKDCGYFQRELIAEIRREYEHNIAQQLYIKSDTWKGVVVAKEQVIALINASAKEVDPKAAGVALGKNVLNKMVRTEEVMPTHRAVRALKEDIQGMFKL